MSRAYIEKDDAFRIKGVHSFFFYYIGDDQTSNLNLIRIHNFELKQKKKTSRGSGSISTSELKSYVTLQSRIFNFSFFNSGKLGIQLKISLKLQND